MVILESGQSLFQKKWKISSMYQDVQEYMRKQIKRVLSAFPVPSVPEKSQESGNDQCIQLNLDVGGSSSKLRNSVHKTTGTKTIIAIILILLNARSTVAYPVETGKNMNPVTVSLPEMDLNMDYIVSVSGTPIGACNTHYKPQCSVEPEFVGKYNFTGEGISWKLTIGHPTCNDTDVTLAKTGCSSDADKCITKVPFHVSGCESPADDNADFVDNERHGEKQNSMAWVAAVVALLLFVGVQFILILKEYDQPLTEMDIIVAMPPSWCHCPSFLPNSKTGQWNDDDDDDDN